MTFTKAGTLVEGLQGCKGHGSHKRKKNIPASASVRCEEYFQSTSTAGPVLAQLRCVVDVFYLGHIL